MFMVNLLPMLYSLLVPFKEESKPQALPTITVPDGIKFSDQAKAIGLKVYSSWSLLATSNKEVQENYVKFVERGVAFWIKKDDLAKCACCYLLLSKNLTDGPVSDQDPAAACKTRLIKEMPAVKEKIYRRIAFSQAVEEVAEHFALKQAEKLAENQSRLKPSPFRLSSLTKAKTEKQKQLQELVSEFQGLDSKNQKQLSKQEKARKDLLKGILVKEGVLPLAEQKIKHFQEKGFNKSENQLYEKILGETRREYNNITLDNPKFKELCTQLAAHPKEYSKYVKREYELVNLGMRIKFSKSPKTIQANASSFYSFFSELVGGKAEHLEQKERAEKNKETVALSIPTAFAKAMREEALRQAREKLTAEDPKFASSEKWNSEFFKQFDKAELEVISQFMENYDPKKGPAKLPIKGKIENEKEFFERLGYCQEKLQKEAKTIHEKLLEVSKEKASTLPKPKAVTKQVKTERRAKVSFADQEHMERKHTASSRELPKDSPLRLKGNRKIEISDKLVDNLLDELQLLKQESGSSFSKAEKEELFNDVCSLAIEHGSEKVPFGDYESQMRLFLEKRKDLSKPSRTLTVAERAVLARELSDLAEIRKLLLLSAGAMYMDFARRLEENDPASTEITRLSKRLHDDIILLNLPSGHNGLDDLAKRYLGK